jgi:hypothetical protein
MSLFAQGVRTMGQWIQDLPASVNTQNPPAVIT